MLLIQECIIILFIPGISISSVALIADRIPSEYLPEMDELIEDLGLEMVGTF